MKKILIPVDFSHESEFATQIGARIAKQSNSEIHLLHLTNLPSGIIDMGAGSQLSIPKNILYLQKLKQKLSKYKQRFINKSVKVKEAIKLQHPFEGIRNYNQKINADLIIMGAHEASEFDRLMLGSSLYKMMRNSKTPIMRVKNELEKFNPKNLVFASNFKDNEKDAFRKMATLANDLNSTLHLVKINNKNHDEQLIKNEIRNFIQDVEINNATINVYRNPSIERGILDFSRDIKADAIAMSTYGKSGILEFFSNSISRRIFKKANKPLITLHV